jgi:hypothetical protein
MPLTNRVTPFGEIVALTARGTLMGNRGILHDEKRGVVRDWQVRRWIACRLEFRGRHRSVMQPGHYTELFFLDEATALADGHRPCAECRHADYLAFGNIWRGIHPDQPASADAIDAILHAERRTRPFSKKTYVAEIESLQDGTYVALDGHAWLVRGSSLHRWSPEGYVERKQRVAVGQVTVLTPPSLVEVLRAGYQPGVHSSVDSSTLE